MKQIIAIIAALILTSGCALIPKIVREAEKPAKEALDIEAESKVKTDVQYIPTRFRCPECSFETDAEGVAVVTKKDIEKKFSLSMSHEGPKFTWWQKVLRWFWGLGVIGIILAIILFVCAPGVLGSLLGRIRPARSYKRMVSALEKAQVKDNAAVSSFLRTELSKKDKARIKKWRAKGKI